MTSHTKDPHSENMWLIATQSLFTEYSIQFEQIQVKDQVKHLFFFYSEQIKLSASASISLYYRLFFFSTLMLVQILENEGVQVNDFAFHDISPIHDSSLLWASQAEDREKLEDLITNVNQSLDVLIYDFENRDAEN
jgi:hypothetical protein